MCLIRSVYHVYIMWAELGHRNFTLMENVMWAELGRQAF